MFFSRHCEPSADGVAIHNLVKYIYLLCALAQRHGSPRHYAPRDDGATYEKSVPTSPSYQILVRYNPSGGTVGPVNRRSF